MSEGTPRPGPWAEWRRALVLLALTFLSTFYVGAESARYGMLKRWPHLTMKWTGLDKTVHGMPGLLGEAGGLARYLAHPLDLLDGGSFALPLMAILIAHEMGHYVAGRIHRVDMSPPYFIPMPIFLLGTMGAVIQMRGWIRKRNVLLDIGAAGPLAGMAVALPVVIYGISISRVGSTHDMLPPSLLQTDGGVFVEGRGLLYLALIYLIKGPLPDGQDIWLSPWALAGWAGFLVTMINLIPTGQLDGGHVAYALFGSKQDFRSIQVHGALPFLGVLVSLVYVARAYLEGQRGWAELSGEAFAGFHWIFWSLLLAGLARASRSRWFHPPTDDEPLSPRRRLVAIGTLLLFGLLFMPSWIYVP